VSTNKNEIQKKLKRGVERNICHALSSMEAKEEKELKERGKERGERV
jgi:hypothetical protein